MYSKKKEVTSTSPTAYLKLFLSAFSRIRTECGEIRRVSPYSVQMRENADQNNSEYGQVLRSDHHSNKLDLKSPENCV